MALDKKDLKEKFIAFGKQFKELFSDDETAEEKAAREKKEADEKAASKTKNFKSEKFGEAKLKDGRMIAYDGETPATGMLVNIADESGNYMPAPDGDYQLEDGSVLTVKDSTIIDMKKGEDTDEQEMSDLEKKIGKLQISQEIEVHKNAIKELKEKQKSFSSNEDVEKLKADFAAQKAVIKSLYELVEKLADLPADDDEHKKNDGFKRIGGRAEAVKAYREMMKRN